MNFISPVFEICVFITVAYMKNFFGFVLAFFACLVSFCQIPSFDRYYEFKVLTFSIFNIMCMVVFVASLLFSSRNLPDYYQKDLQLETKVMRNYLGAYIPYKKHSFINAYVIDFDNADGDLVFNVCVLAFSLVSGYILYHLKLGSLCSTVFKDQAMEDVELPPETTFKETQVELEKQIKESYYINYFLKKAFTIFKLDLKSVLDEKENLTVAYVKTIPYMDVKALIKKIKLYTKYRKRGEMDTQLTQRLVSKIYSFIFETIQHILTISNIVYASLFAYVAFFFYFKNQNASLFSFLPFIGIFLLGITKFQTFIFYSQFLVGVPLIFNFMIFYFSNLPIDIAKCKDNPVFYCQTWFGMINRSATPSGTSAVVFKELIVKIALFQGIFFFYRMLKFTNELFVEKSDKELNLEIEESFNRGSLPFIKIVIIQIMSRFYLICFVLMLYIGTSQPSYTNMVLLIVAIIFMTKFKLVKKRWIIIYVIMNMIFILAYFIDLFLSDKQKGQNYKLLALFGLPTNTVESGTVAAGSLNDGKLFNKVLVMVLYICCLIQQIAGRNRYIKCYLIKLNKVKNSDSWLVQNVSNWYQKLKMMIIKVYYKSSVWMSYMLNIYLPLFLSISIFRGLLLVTIVATFIIHINAIRKANSQDKLYLNTTYTCWKIFLVLKVINLCMLVVGAFGLNEQVRDSLNIIKDSEDYEIINYVGIESLEPDIINSIFTLQNCRMNYYIQTNRLRFYFIAECVTFIMTKVAMKVIQIQRLYNNNLAGYITTFAQLENLRKNKPKLYRIHKIYHRYIIGGKFSKNKKANKLMDNFGSFLARTSTSVIYFVTLSISVLYNISVLMFISLYYFLRYFIQMNTLFLNYLTKESVEKVVEFSKPCSPRTRELLREVPQLHRAGPHGRHQRRDPQRRKPRRRPEPQVHQRRGQEVHQNEPLFAGAQAQVQHHQVRRRQQVQALPRHQDRHDLHPPAHLRQRSPAKHLRQETASCLVHPVPQDRIDCVRLQILQNRQQLSRVGPPALHHSLHRSRL